MSGVQLPPGFQIVQTFGDGHEGTIYEALKDGRKYVLKVFRDVSGSEADLEAYCERVRAQEAGLFPGTLVYRGAQIAGLYYSAPPLFHIPMVVYRHLESVRQALVSQYGFTQAYLMRQHAMEIVDGAQFMSAEGGQLYFVDYGPCIVRADNGWCRTRGFTVFSLLRVLFQTMGTILDGSVRQPGFDYGQPCEWVRPAQWEALLHRSPWTRPIVGTIRNSPAEVFLDPDFYTWIAGLHGRVVPAGKWEVAPEKLLRTIAPSGTLGHHLG